MYSTYQIQQNNDTNCSEWCLFMLNGLNKGEDFIDIIIDILNKHKLHYMKDNVKLFLENKLTECELLIKKRKKI